MNFYNLINIYKRKYLCDYYIVKKLNNSSGFGVFYMYFYGLLFLIIICNYCLIFNIVDYYYDILDYYYIVLNF